MLTRLHATIVLALLLALAASAASDYEAMCCLSGPSLTYSAQSITPGEIPPYGEVSVSVMVSNNGDMAAIVPSPLEVYSSPTGFYGFLSPIDGIWLVPRGSSKIFAGAVTAPGTEGGYALYSNFTYSSAVNCGVTHNGTLNISLGAVTVRQATPTSCYLVPSSFTTAVGSFTSIAAHCELDGTELPCPYLEWTTSGGTMSPATTSPQLSPSSTFTAQTTPASGRTVTASSGKFSCSATFDVLAASPSQCAISPSSASLAPSALQSFSLSCFDSYHNAVTCYPSFPQPSRRRTIPEAAT
ncbi:MAG: hypothetical protein NT157_04005 [Candidatus Micrarchaeota archaeon]|nr:hypothetical protein [Candidatus Micrarchaeota archaeon]